MKGKYDIKMGGWKGGNAGKMRKKYGKNARNKGVNAYK